MTAICVVDDAGCRLWRGQCATVPEQIGVLVRRHAGDDARLGIETGAMTPWLVQGFVTSANGTRNKSSRTSGSSRSNDFVPCLHRRGPEGSVRSCRGEMTLDVEGILCCCMRGEKSLRGPHALEPLHLALPSSGRLMRILGSVVAPSAALMAFCNPKIMGCGSIRPQLIRDELVGNKAVFLQKLAHQFQRRLLVSSGLDQNVKHFALGVDGAPEVDHAAIDLEINFVQMPGRMRLRPAFAQVGCDTRPKWFTQRRIVS